MVVWSKAPRPRQQVEMLSPSLDEQIGQSDGVRFLDALLGEVDWSQWEQVYHQEGPGRPTHHPRIMCAAILLGLIRGFHSTRSLEYATRYCLDFQWLLDGRSIDHSTFAKFRTLHGERIKGLFRQINRKAAKLKRLSLEEVIVDGTRIRADSDRHGARSAEALQRRLAALEGKIEAALERLEKAREHGHKDEIANSERENKELQARKQRDEQALEVARQRDVQKRRRKGSGSTAVRVPVTDPDAHILPNKEGGYAPNYTPLIAVEAQTGLIVAQQISGDGGESGHLEQLAQEVEQSLGAKPRRIIGDEGFVSGHDLRDLKDRGIEAYMPIGGSVGVNCGQSIGPGQAVPSVLWDALPQRRGKWAREAFLYDALADVYYCPMGHALSAYRQHRRCDGNEGVRVTRYTGAPCQGCKLASRCLTGKSRSRVVVRDEYEPYREELRERMSSPRGREVYGRRAPLVEGAFGTIKQAMGIRRFYRRGLLKVRDDWTWACLAFNLKKVMGWMGEAPTKGFAAVHKLNGRYLAVYLHPWHWLGFFGLKSLKTA